MISKLHSATIYLLKQKTPSRGRRFVKSNGQRYFDFLKARIISEYRNSFIWSFDLIFLSAPYNDNSKAINHNKSEKS